MLAASQALTRPFKCQGLSNLTPSPRLPRTERTAYKKKLNKKFKDRDIGRGTQGAGTASAQQAM